MFVTDYVPSAGNAKRSLQNARRRTTVLIVSSVSHTRTIGVLAFTENRSAFKTANDAEIQCPSAPQNAAAKAPRRKLHAQHHPQWVVISRQRPLPFFRRRRDCSCSRRIPFGPFAPFGEVRGRHAGDDTHDTHPSSVVPSTRKVRRCSHVLHSHHYHYTTLPPTPHALQ